MAKTPNSARPPSLIRRCTATVCIGLIATMIMSILASTFGSPSVMVGASNVRTLDASKAVAIWAQYGYGDASLVPQWATQSTDVLRTWTLVVSKSGESVRNLVGLYELRVGWPARAFAGAAILDPSVLL